MDRKQWCLVNEHKGIILCITEDGEVRRFRQYEISNIKAQELKLLTDTGLIDENIMMYNEIPRNVKLTFDGGPEVKKPKVKIKINCGYELKAVVYTQDKESKERHIAYVQIKGPRGARYILNSCSFEKLINQVFIGENTCKIKSVIGNIMKNYNNGVVTVGCNLSNADIKKIGLRYKMNAILTSDEENKIMHIAENFNILQKALILKYIKNNS